MCSKVLKFSNFSNRRDAHQASETAREAAQAEAAAEGGGGAAEGGGGAAEGGGGAAEGGGGAAGGSRRARGARGGHADGSGAGRDDPSRDDPSRTPAVRLFREIACRPAFPGGRRSSRRSRDPCPDRCWRPACRVPSRRARAAAPVRRRARARLACIRPSSRRSKTSQPQRKPRRGPRRPPLEHRGKAACSSAASPSAR